MFSRDEMQRAIEDALKSMEGVALELYRRGREESREELETVKRERDEARAEVERLRTQYASTVLEHAKMLSEAVDVSKRQKRLADRAHDQACRLAAKLDAQSTDQFRRGAEAMRMACIGVACAQDSDLDAQDRMEERLLAIQMPEEP